MDLPPNLSKLIQQNLKAVRQDPDHHIYFQERIEVLQAFGLLSTPNLEVEENKLNSDWSAWYYIPVNLTLAGRAFGWLAMLTARKVLPIWEQFGLKDDEESLEASFDPAKMIETGEGFLLGKISSSAAKIDLCNRFYYSRMWVAEKTHRNVFAALEAAYSGLKAIFNGTENDFTAFAAIAYAGKDENEPGVWFEEHLREQEEVFKLWFEKNETPKASKETLNFREDLDISTERDKSLENFKPITFSPQKELEFWEWWLTEAIPQAWELAHRGA